MRNGGSKYQQFAIPQKPDRRAAYGRHERGHPDMGGTVTCWMLVYRSFDDDDIVLPVQYSFGLCLELTHGLGGLNDFKSSETGDGGKTRQLR